MRVCPICGDEHEDVEFVGGICINCASTMAM